MGGGGTMQINGLGKNSCSVLPPKLLFSEAASTGSPGAPAGGGGTHPLEVRHHRGAEVGPARGGAQGLVRWGRARGSRSQKRQWRRGGKIEESLPCAAADRGVPVRRHGDANASYTPRSAVLPDGREIGEQGLGVLRAGT